MKKEKKSFFERITGIGSFEHDSKAVKQPQGENWTEQDQSEAQLAVDVYQTPTEIIVISMIAGVKSEDLDISITREMVSIKAKREEPEAPEKEKYVYKELFWGSFGRTVVLPDEVDAENSEAIEKHGLLIIRMPKINKNQSKSLKVKSL
ncbi:MAG: Hsp20/alpha crystallin family protein [Candidatus Vogelbacteria bacterium]|nr:Hsp20/alpha crystallin family protein [Candidatus Vogelbacteria bacterium]